MTFWKEKPNLCPRFVVLAGSSSFIPRKLPGLLLCFWKDSWDGWRPSGEEPGTSNVLEQPVGAMWPSCFQFSRTPLRSLMVKEPQTP